MRALRSIVAALFASASTIAPALAQSIGGLPSGYSSAAAYSDPTKRAPTQTDDVSHGYPVGSFWLYNGAGGGGGGSGTGGGGLGGRGGGPLAIVWWN